MKVNKLGVAAVFIVPGVIFIGLGIFVFYRINTSIYYTGFYSYSFAPLIFGVLLCSLGLTLAVKGRWPKILVVLSLISYLTNFFVGYFEGRNLFRNIISKKVTIYAEILTTSDRSNSLPDKNDWIILDGVDLPEAPGLAQFHDKKIRPRLSLLDSFKLPVSLSAGIEPIPPEVVVIKLGESENGKEIYIRNYKWVYGAFVYDLPKDAIREFILELKKGQPGSNVKS